MPSWNIHIAQTERLLAEGSVSRVVRDCNSFLFGNLIPDIYVGYMVPGVVRPIPYRITHFACPEHIPKPREGEFWEAYVAPLAAEVGLPAGDSRIEVTLLSERAARTAPSHAATFTEDVDVSATARLQDAAFAASGIRDDGLSDRRSLFDLVLGAWAHLVADNIWNERVSDVLKARGEKPNSGFRIKKQGDFDLFGKSLAIDAIPVATPRLVEAASRFPQYAIDERSVYYSVAVAHETVRTNHLNFEPTYQLLDADFFDRTFCEVLDVTSKLLVERLELSV